MRQLSIHGNVGASFWGQDARWFMGFVFGFQLTSRNGAFRVGFVVVWIQVLFMFDQYFFAWKSTVPGSRTVVLEGTRRTARGSLEISARSVGEVRHQFKRGERTWNVGVVYDCMWDCAMKICGSWDCCHNLLVISIIVFIYIWIWNNNEVSIINSVE